MIRYKRRTLYKYTLFENYQYQTALTPGEAIETTFTTLSQDGLLTIKKGYAWDGPSGPTIDTKNFMRGSLVHDVLYQLIRSGRLTQDCRRYADKLLRAICIESGMSRLRAWWVYWGVRLGGRSSTTDMFEAP